MSHYLRGSTLALKLPQTRSCDIFITADEDPRESVQISRTAEGVITRKRSGKRTADRELGNTGSKALWRVAS